MTSVDVVPEDISGDVRPRRRDPRLLVPVEPGDEQQSVAVERTGNMVERPARQVDVRVENRLGGGPVEMRQRAAGGRQDGVAVKLRALDAELVGELGEDLFLTPRSFRPIPRIGVEETEQRDLLAEILKFGRDLVDEQTTDRPAEQGVRTGRLDRADLLQMRCRQPPYREGRAFGAGHAGRLQPDDGLVGAEVLDEPRVAPAEAAGRMDAEERRPGAAWLQRKNDAQCVLRTRFLEVPGEAGDGRGFEEGADREFDAECGAEPADGARGEE